MHTNAKSPLLQLSNIVKRYPGVLALDSVNFDLRAGEVHCLLGENGAGKSTLLKILSGALSKDEGEILLDGKPVTIGSPAEAQQLGVCTIYQESKLVPALSVAENIVLGHEPVRRSAQHAGGPTRGVFAILDQQEAQNNARAALSQLGEQLDLDEPVEYLSVAQQQIVEIAKTLSRRARVLAMDEPTASLTESERENLFTIIRRLKNEGVGIIYVSHRLEEIFDIADRITVLRDGRVINSCAISETDRQTLIRWMVGRELGQEYPHEERTRGEEILRLDHVTAGVLNDISLTIHRGEILGLAGLVGAGRTELARVIFGADSIDSGTMSFFGRRHQPRSPREAIDAGIGLLTEDRNRLGLITEMSAERNITLANIEAILQNGLLSKEKERAAAEAFIDQLRIKLPSADATVETLSGGNRQKVVLARWLFTDAKLLIFDEPTAGIDVGVKYEIYKIINDLAQRGIGIIVISSDLPELLGVCDRIAVMCGGTITGALTRAEATQEKVMALATRF